MKELLSGAQIIWLKIFRRRKHVDLKLHHVPQHTELRSIKLIKIRKTEIFAEFSTKPLERFGIGKELKAVNIVTNDGRDVEEESGI